MREEVFQELVLTCVQVVSKYDFQQTHQFLQFGGSFMREGIYVEAWIDFIANVGFPIFITIYLLVRLERIMAKVIDSLDELKKMLSNDKEVK